MKNSNDAIGNRTRDFPAVPQPTASQCGMYKHTNIYFISVNYNFSFNVYEIYTALTAWLYLITIPEPNVTYRLCTE